MKTVTIVDDHEMIRIGLKCWLETKTDWIVIDGVSSCMECLDSLQKYQPAVVLIDVDLGTESGFDLITAIKSAYPEIKIIMYSMHDQTGYVLKAESLGAQGYVSKAADTDEFKKGLEAVYNGELYLERRLEDSKSKLRDIEAVLNKKEFAIFLEMLMGKNNDEISKDMNLKKHSLEVYISMIYEKTFTKNRSELLEKYK